MCAVSCVIQFELFEVAPFNLGHPKFLLLLLQHAGPIRGLLSLYNSSRCT